jgi:chemotaxis signal transduction protein
MKRAAIQWDQARKQVQASEDSLRRALSESPGRIKAVFRRRAVQLASEHAEKKPVAPGIPALIVRVTQAGVRQERYAIALKDLAEVLPFQGCTQIPGASRQFSGVINLRGDLRPVIDLAWVLSGSPSSDSGTILVLRRPAALKVDAVEDLREIALEELTPPVEGHYVQALRSGTLGLLDVETMLSAVFSPKESRSQ